MLSSTPPASTRAHHWSLAWIGFDVLLALLLAGCCELPVAAGCLALGIAPARRLR